MPDILVGAVPVDPAIENAFQAWLNHPEPLVGAGGINNLQADKKKMVMPAPLAPSPDHKVWELYGCGNELLRSTELFHAGLECEIEAIPAGKATHVGIFDCKEDNSLRNDGWEYVSIPATRDVLIEQFQELQKFLNLHMDRDPFSYRTSLHVHVNVANMSLKQAKNMLLLYALFEEFFFSLAKPARRNNIHCVPLTDTHLPSKYHKDILHLRNHWTKYAALNICRLRDLGTFEFRHLHGTGDVNEVSVWLKILDNLWTLSRQVVIDEEALSDHARIYAWFDTIFNPSEKTMMLGGQLHNIIQNSLVDVKFSTIKE